MGVVDQGLAVAGAGVGVASCLAYATGLVAVVVGLERVVGRALVDFVQGPGGFVVVVPEEGRGVRWAAEPVRGERAGRRVGVGVLAAHCVGVDGEQSCGVVGAGVKYEVCGGRGVDRVAGPALQSRGQALPVGVVAEDIVVAGGIRRGGDVAVAVVPVAGAVVEWVGVAVELVVAVVSVDSGPRGVAASCVRNCRREGVAVGVVGQRGPSGVDRAGDRVRRGRVQPAEQSVSAVIAVARADATGKGVGVVNLSDTATEVVVGVGGPGAAGQDDLGEVAGAVVAVAGDVVELVGAGGEQAGGFGPAADRRFGA